MRQVYKIIVELEDTSESDGEDIELAVEEALAYLPDDLVAHVIEVEPVEDDHFEDYE
jgi:hypothetical protein